MEKEGSCRGSTGNFQLVEMTNHIHQGIYAYTKGPGHPMQTSMKTSAPHARVAFLPLIKTKFRKPKNHMENKISLYHLVVQCR